MVSSRDKQMDWSFNHHEYCFVNTCTLLLENKIKLIVGIPTSPLNPPKKITKIPSILNYVLPFNGILTTLSDNYQIQEQ